MSTLPAFDASSHQTADFLVESTAGRREKLRRIHRAMDRMHNDLAEPLDLKALAACADLSPFHFVRVFAQVTGETPAQHLRRIRLQRAASLLHFWPDASILDVALATGFQSAAVFARAFRAHFGMAATRWRRADFWRPCGLFACWRPTPCRECETYGEWFSGAPQGPFKNRQWPPSQPPGLEAIGLERVPTQRVAYMRTIGPLGTMIPVWRRLIRWAGARGLIGPDALMFGQMLEDPHIAAPRHYRYDAGVIVGDDFVPDSYVNVRTVHGGPAIKVKYIGRMIDTTSVFRYLWSVWVPENGYLASGVPQFSCVERRENPDLGEPDSESVIRWTFYLPVLDRSAPMYRALGSHGDN